MNLGTDEAPVRRHPDEMGEPEVTWFLLNRGVPGRSQPAGSGALRPWQERRDLYRVIQRGLAVYSGYPSGAKDRNLAKRHEIPGNTANNPPG